MECHSLNYCTHWVADSYTETQVVEPNRIHAVKIKLTITLFSHHKFCFTTSKSNDCFLQWLLDNIIILWKSAGISFTLLRNCTKYEQHTFLDRGTFQLSFCLHHQFSFKINFIKPIFITLDFCFHPTIPIGKIQAIISLEKFVVYIVVSWGCFEF